MSGDIVNGLFELIGGLLLFLNCRRLYRDKQLKGVSVLPTMFYAAWGYWNLYYYPSLGQWLSFYAGIVVVTANTTWVALALYYLRQNRRYEALEREHLGDPEKKTGIYAETKLPEQNLSLPGGAPRRRRAGLKNWTGPSPWQESYHNN